MASKQKFVYHFAEPKAEGNKEMKALLGGKGANLAEMVNIGIPVPPGFTISTEVCKVFEESQGNLPANIKDEIVEHVRSVEKEIGKKFGDSNSPLLFSIRSGAAASMPGMMDTVLNLGLNDATVQSLVASNPANARFVYDSYRRFLTMYADVVMSQHRKEYEHLLQLTKDRLKVKFDSEVPAEALKELCEQYKQLYQKGTGEAFPMDPMLQLFASVNAVFRSWGNPRAVTYRRLYHITGLIGTAVNVQSMVFGNFNTSSATGVAFSRSPSTGDNHFYGEYLINAQGEDVVAGIRTPQQISKMMSQEWARDHGISEADRLAKFPSMEEAMPQNYRLLVDFRGRLERHYTDMQDLEFTVENNKLWMLQCRNAKRTAKAAIKCAVDMVAEGLINKEEAVMRVDPEVVNHLLHPSLNSVKGLTKLAKGLAASPGAAVGQIVFNAEDAQKWKNAGKKVIMVRLETSPEDLAGMDAAEGILTVRGGMTSHAAVVARGMGKTCVAGCGDIVLKGKTFSVSGKTLSEGEWITLDGTKGIVYAGKAKLESVSLAGDFHTIMKWCQGFKRLAVRANADNGRDAKHANEFGAEGVGLCRTEHMFFEGTRIDAMREMILADTMQGREKALAKVEPLQKADFSALFKEMQGKPVTIRLLDPPLHEFVPHDAHAQRELAQKIGCTPEHVAKRVKALHESNPMLGHRGCRLGISYPEIYNMQVHAIISAAVEAKRQGIDVHPEIMIPLVGKKEELSITKKNCCETAEAVLAKNKDVNVHYSVGTMIEVPRAALTADEIAEDAEFFSFGTNDLTQMGCGFSRDDAGPFLRRYQELGIYTRDPFQSLDISGIGQLVRIAAEKGRKVRPLIKLGICGEHGGDPITVMFCHSIGLNYVSCSPFRVPIAIVAAAHAAIMEKRDVTTQHKRLASASKL